MSAIAAGIRGNSTNTEYQSMSWLHRSVGYTCAVILPLTSNDNDTEYTYNFYNCAVTNK